MLKARTDVIDAEIEEIPDYNVDRGRTHGLKWTWIPTAEDYRRYPITLPYWERDAWVRELLGLESCRRPEDEVKAHDRAWNEENDW